MFYCQCVPPYGKGYNLSFKVDKSNSNPEKQLPKFSFLSWKELSEIAIYNYAAFNENYRFFITELLPDKTYLTSEVLLVNYKDGIKNFIKLTPP